PMPIILKPSTPSLPPVMLATWLMSRGVFTLLYVGFVIQRYALSYLRVQMELVGDGGSGKGEASTSTTERRLHDRGLHCHRRDRGRLRRVTVPAGAPRSSPVTPPAPRAACRARPAPA